MRYPSYCFLAFFTHARINLLIKMIELISPQKKFVFLKLFCFFGLSAFSSESNSSSASSSVSKLQKTIEKIE